MKIDGKTDPQAPRPFNSAKVKKAIVFSVLAGIIFCIVLLLSPVQKYLFTFSGADISGLLSLPFIILLVLLFVLCCLFAEKISTFLEDSGSSRLISITAAAVILGVLGFTGVFSYLYGRQWIDSDHASEMILGKLLAEDNALLSARWHYGLELRVVYQTIFTMPLFKLLGRYENWALIRSFNIVLNNLVLILAYIFMMKQMKVQKKWILISGFFLLMSQSLEYWKIVTFGGIYIFFIAQVFCCLGLFAALSDHAPAAKAGRVYFVLLLLLSFALGVQGIRALYTIFVPLFIVCVYIYIMRKGEETRFSLLAGSCSFLCFCAGYAVNYLLSFRYSFHTFENMRIEDLSSNFLPKLGQSLIYLAGFFGFTAGSPFLSARGFFSMAAIIGTFLLFWAVYKNVRTMRPQSENHFMLIFFLVSALFNIFVFIVADKPVTSRYFLLFMIFYIPLAAIFFGHAEKVYESLQRAMAVCGIALFIAGQGYLNFKTLVSTDFNSIRKGYIQYLLDNRLDYGFATFWNANVTTELSNDRIEVAGLGRRIRPELGGSQFLILDSLIQAKFLDPSWHSGESFLLLTSDEWDLFRGRFSAGKKPDYKDDNFVILKYPSAEVIYEDVLGM